MYTEETGKGEDSKEQMKDRETSLGKVMLFYSYRKERVNISLFFLLSLLFFFSFFFFRACLPVRFGI